MSHFTTHHIFGQQVLKAADSQTSRLIENNLPAFCWGMQGADLLYAHRHVNEYSELPNYGRLIHGEKTNTLFTFLAHDLLNHRKCLDFETLLSYYYGFCCHYALDRSLHPYVFALQKQIEDAANGSRAFGSSHWYIEDGIDRELSDALAAYTPSIAPGGDYYLADRSLRRTVGGLYSRILWNVYSLRVPATTIEECFVDELHRTDMIYGPDGRMKPYATLESAALQSYPDLASFFAGRAPTDSDCLNLKKISWCHHGDNVTRTDSVIEVMTAAKELALTLWQRSATAIRQGNRHLITAMDFSRSFVDGKYRK